MGLQKKPDSDSLHEYEFTLESFLTRPRTCSKLFPPRVQKQRYQRITVQERLILISAGPSTKDAVKNEDSEGQDKKEWDARAVLVAGLEVLEYLLVPLAKEHTKLDTQLPYERIVYIAKVDTSGCWPLPGLDTGKGKSPARALVSGYLKAVRSKELSRTLLPNANTTSTTATAVQMSSLKISPSAITPGVHQDLQEQDQGGEHGQLQQPKQSNQNITRKTSLYIFARAQPQYLFADSAKNSGKHVLDDRGLVRWWKNMVASVYNNNTSSSAQDGPSQTDETKVQGWWHIPGIETERQAMNVIKATSTTGSPSSTSASGFSWNYGYPDKGSKEMAHTLIPQFPDDPKSRMMQSPSCAGGFVNIHTFWELAAIGEESGAGKITGFFRVIEEDQAHEDNEYGQTGKTAEELASAAAAMTASTPASASASAKGAVTGTEDSYTRVINFLLGLDFSTAEVSRDSTDQWRDRVKVWIERASKKESEQEGNRQQLPWIQKGTVSMQLRHADEIEKAQEQVSEQTTQSTTPTILEKAVSTQQNPPVVVHTLGAGLIKRKTPSSTTPTSATTPVAPSLAVNVLNPSLIKRKVTATPATETAPAVNVLSPNLIKRKSTTTTTTTPAATIATEPPMGTPSSSPPSSAPAVNVLGASFIKKRKVDP
ncbi:histone acetylation protein-domain-containing protein [Dissophora ornata]|nr:histone acetylation protein-domain-containing protein [Dissophora ornata]